MQSLSQQIEQAAAANKFDEATALQAELDGADFEAAALASEHGFASEEAQDLLPASPPAAAIPASPTQAAALPNPCTR